MSLHSVSKVWIHLIWETLDRSKLLTGDKAKTVSEFLFKYSKEKQFFMSVNYVNSDHVHALVDLPTGITIEDVVKLYKGASSHFINQNKIAHNFRWGRGYAVFSVSESHLEKVKAYIQNQHEHHKVNSFPEEYELFMIKYGMVSPQ